MSQSKGLIVLDRARISGPDPYRVLRDNDSALRDTFAILQYTTDLAVVLSAARDIQDGVVVVVGPTFIEEFAEGRDVLVARLVEAGIAPERIIIGTSRGGTTNYSHVGKLVNGGIIGIVLRVAVGGRTK